jgi:universal stress protein family protein
MIVPPDPTTGLDPQPGRPLRRRELPLLFCRPGRERLERLRELGGAVAIRRIVAVLDASQASRTVHRFAVALARSTQATLDLVGVLDAFSELFHRGNHALSDDPGGYLARVEAALDVAVRVTRCQGVPCSGRVLVGAPVLEISRYVLATEADLVLLSASVTSAVQLLRALPWRRQLL